MSEPHPPALDRRSLLHGVAAGATTSLALGTPLLAPLVTRPAYAAATWRKLPSVPARQADDLVDFVGINTHLNFRTSVYDDTDRVMSALRVLGVRHVRDHLVREHQNSGAFATLANRGTRVQAVCSGLEDNGSMDALMAGVRADHAHPSRVFSAFEGINEPNNDGRPWIDVTTAKARALHAARRAHSLGHIPIAAPAIARVTSGGVEGADTPHQVINLGSLSPWVDLGNMHVYPRSQLPSADIARFERYATYTAGDVPIVCSEAGYFTALSYQGTAYPTPPAVVAKYLPRLVFEHWIRGTQRLFLYELLDDYDPSNSVRESSFGLIAVGGSSPSAPWTAKPGFLALRNLLSILSDPGKAHDVGGLRLEVHGPTSVRTALLSQRDGTRFLALWRDVQSYDPAARSRSPVTSAPVRLHFAHRVRLSVFNPVRSARAVQSLGRSRHAKLDVADELLLVRIR